MISTLKSLKKLLKEINNIILQDFKTTIYDINNQIDMSNNNIENLMKKKII